MFNIRKVTNLFKQTGVKIDFRGKNTLAHLVKTTNTTRTPTINKPGIYQLTCSTCNLAYICQTSRDLKTRFHEHIRYIKNNNPQSVHAQHTLNNRHQFGTIDNIMTLLKPIHSQHLLTTNEQLYIRAFLSQKQQTHFWTIPRHPQTLSLSNHPPVPHPALTGPVVLRTAQWTLCQPTGSDSLTAATLCTLICLHTELHLHTAMRPPPTTPHIITTHSTLTLDLP